MLRFYRDFTEGEKKIPPLSTPWDKRGLASPERENTKNLALSFGNVLVTTPYCISRFLSFNSQASIFMGFSITSSVFGGIIIICYGLAIAIYRDERNYYSSRRYRKSYDEEMAFTVIILILGIVEFAIGIWASVCICLTKPCPCNCCNASQQQVSLWKVTNREVIDST